MVELPVGKVVANRVIKKDDILGHDTDPKFLDSFYIGCVSFTKAWFSDGEILEVNQVLSYFNYINRIVLGLGISLKGDFSFIIKK